MPKMELPQQVAKLDTTPTSVVGQSRMRTADFSKILNQALSRSNTPADVGVTAHRDGNKKQGDFQQKMLGIRAYRQQLIASNIANSDTPGYRAMDIDVEDAAKQNQMELLPLAKLSPSHINGSAHWSSPPFNLKYRTPFQASADANTVEMDIERQHFAENAVMYQFTLDQVGGDFKELTELFRNLK